MKKIFALLLATSAMLVPTHALESATYKVTFKGSFNRANFNNSKFPRNPHFSPLVVSSHAPAFDLTKLGTMATLGVKNVAETGSTTVLRQELKEQNMRGHVLEVAQGSGISGTGSTSIEITVTKDYPLISAISMIAPSPDWIVSVSGLSLLDGDTFIKQLTVPLYAQDAGTDSGKYYGSGNKVTKPQGLILPLIDVSGSPIKNAFGTLTIQMI